MTLEDLRWDESHGPSRGRLATNTASTYKLPSFSEMPEEFTVTLLERAHEDGAVHGSKAVGEPPFMLGISVLEALSMAAASVAEYRIAPRLDAPATPERVLMAIERLRAAARQGTVAKG